MKQPWVYMCSPSRSPLPTLWFLMITHTVNFKLKMGKIWFKLRINEASHCPPSHLAMWMKSKWGQQGFQVEWKNKSQTFAWVSIQLISLDQITLKSKIGWRWHLALDEGFSFLIKILKQNCLISITMKADLLKIILVLEK